MARNATADPSVLSTGEAARLLRCSHSHVIKMCNSGRLKFWRVPPGKVRRIERAELERVARECGIPLPAASPDGVA